MLNTNLSTNQSTKVTVLTQYKFEPQSRTFLEHKIIITWELFINFMTWYVINKLKENKTMMNRNSE